MRGGRICIATLVFALYVTLTNGCETYSLVSPKMLRVGAEETLYLNLEHCSGRYQVTAQLQSLPRHLHTVNVHEGFHDATEPIPIVVKPLQGMIEIVDGHEKLLIIVQVTWCLADDCDSTKRIINQLFALNTTNGYMFVKTNRPAYRPEDHVKIAVVSLNDNLLLNTVDPVTVIIRTPKKYGAVDIHKERMEPGAARTKFLHFDFMIPKEPIPGNWTVDALVNGKVMGSASFWVDKYVTPKFKVTVKVSKHYILPTDQIVSGTIKAEYSFGNPVRGNYFMRYKLVRPGIGESIFHNNPSGSKLLSLGYPENFDFRLKHVLTYLHQTEPRITLGDLADEGASLKIEVLVNGYAEGESEGEILSGILFTKSPYKIDTVRTSRFYMPDVSYELKAQILDVVTHMPVQDVDVNIARSVDNEETQETSNADGEIYSVFDNMAGDSVTFTISTPDGSATASVNVRKYTSEAQHYLGMRFTNRDDAVGDKLFVIFQTKPHVPKEINYFIVARGKIVLGKRKIVDEGHTGDITDDFTITEKMVPTARLVAYYIKDGVMSSNSIWFNVANECNQPFTIRRNLNTNNKLPKVFPGSPVKFTLTGPRDSTMQIWGVDRSAYYVYNESRLTRDFLWEEMGLYDVGCSLEGGPNNRGVFDQAGLKFESSMVPTDNYYDISCHSNQNGRKRRSPPETIQQRDHLLARCNSTGYKTMDLSCRKRADLVGERAGDQCKQVFLTACYHMRRLTRRRSSLGRSFVVNNAIDRVPQQPRKMFDENWIWEEIDLRNGRKDYTKNALDSITTYDIGAFGVGANSAFCVAEPVTVAVKKNIFVKLYLPYSIKLHEQAIIRYTVFNLGDDAEDLVVKLKLQDELCTKFGKAVTLGDGVKLGRPGGTQVYGEGGTMSGSFSVMALRMADGGGKTTKVEMKVFSLTRRGEKIEDLVEKKLLIEEPGRTIHKSKTFPLEANDPINFDLEIGNDAEPDTTKCSLTFYANMLGPYIEVSPMDGKLSNLENLLHIPYGCGEQNMKAMGPNIFVYNYRVHKGQVTDQQRQIMIEYLKKGYAIELKWRSDRTNDRAFAVWHHHKPSIWLNGYVLKVFSMAKKIASDHLDVQHLCTALKWLIDHNNENSNDGSFTEIQRVYHNEMDGEVNDKTSLTAYMIASMHETQEHCPGIYDRVEGAMTQGKDYLNLQLRRNDLQVYTIAMIAYALAIVEPSEPNTVLWNEKLFRKISVPVDDRNLLYFVGGFGRASDIETTSYALLAELNLNGISQTNQDKTSKLRKWLLKQRNERGGFVSTQDTVMALQALTKYREIHEQSNFAPPDTDLTVRLLSSNENSEWGEEPHIVHIQQTNENTAFKVDVPRSIIGSEITAEVEGVGEGTMSYHCRWKEIINSTNCFFQIDLVLTKAPPKQLKMTILVRKFNPNDLKRMTMVEIGVPSGYTIETKSLDNLLKSEHLDGIIDSYDETENTINVYLSAVTTEGVDIPGIILKQEVAIANPVPVPVTVYEYDKRPETSCTKFYDANKIGDEVIKTVGCEDGEICKCAEQECPVCRTRDDQLHKTMCVDGMLQGCQTCSPETYANDECRNIKQIMCDNNCEYVHLITVGQQIDADNERYFKFNATVVSVLKSGRLGGDAKQMEIYMHKPCYEKCHDPFIEERQRKKKLDPMHYIAHNKTMLIRGKGPEKIQDRLVYFATSETTMEHVPDKMKCRGYNTKARKNRKKHKANPPRLNDVLKLCDMVHQLESALKNGCG